MRVIRFILIMGIFLSLGIIFFLNAPPQYIATVELAVNEGLCMDEMKSSYPSLKEFIAHQKDIILNSPILSKVIEDLHMNLYTDTQKVMDKLKRQISVEIIGGSLIKIRVRTDSYQLSSRIADVLADKYLEVFGKEKFFWSERVKEMLDKEWDWVKLHNEKMAKFQRLSKGKTIDIWDKERLNVQVEINRFKEEKDKAQMDLSKLESEYEEIKKMYEQPVVFFSLDLNNKTLKSLLDKYEDIQNKIYTLSKVYTDNHPSLEKLRQEKKELDGKIKTLLQDILNDYQLKIKESKRFLEELDKEIVNYNKKYEDITETIDQLLILKKEIDFLEEKIKDVKNKLDQKGFFPVDISHLRVTPLGFTPVEKISSGWGYIYFYSLIGLIFFFIVEIIIKIFREERIK